MNLKRQIVELARRENQWLNGGRFERLAMDLGYKPSNASRRCRELVNEGLLERRINDKKCVEYKFIPPKPLTPKEIKAEEEEHLRLALM